MNDKAAIFDDFLDSEEVEKFHQHHYTILKLAFEQGYQLATEEAKQQRLFLLRGNSSE